MKYSSLYFEKAVEQFSKLPGVGKKTAMRYILFLLKQDISNLENFIESLSTLKNNINFCEECNNISDNNICSICNDISRNKKILCVVENIRDVIAIENTNNFNGLYYVLGGLISPLDGIGPDQLKIETLINKLNNEKFDEIIFALNPNLKGDTTIFYICKLIDVSKLKITSISRGIAFGGEIEYADDLTLARSLEKRLPIENYVKN